MATSSFSYVRGWQNALDSKGWWHSFELPDGRRIDGVNTVLGQQRRISQFPIPDDLRGARVLDIGAWDGWFTFEMERRGADVLAVDCWDNPRFHQAHAALDSRAQYRVMDVYELTPSTVGCFDIVLFMGVLYHLKHPLLALERVCAVTSGFAAVDSFVLREGHRPGENVEKRTVMEFYETEEFGGQSDNWCAPSLPCLTAMCRTAGFARVDHRATLEYGACVACFRKWIPAPETYGVPPDLVDAFHHTNFGINFQTRYDEYVGIRFRIASGPCSLDELFPEVGGYGLRPINVGLHEDGFWQANFKLPPGLPPGWHDVTLRIGKGPLSNARRIAVDFPEEIPPAIIEGVSDGTTWEPNVLNLTHGHVLSAWVAGLPENADRVNVLVRLGGERTRVVYVEPPTSTLGRQINIEIPANAPSGAFQLEVNHSKPVTVHLQR